MNPGRLNKRITIEKYIPHEDGVITKGSWEPYKQVWASANDLYGEEFWKAKECGYESVVMFTVRYSKDIANINSREYRINWKSKLYNVISIDNVQYSNTIIKIKTKEVER